MRVQQSFNIPASHESVLGRYGDDSGRLVGRLAVGDEPGNGFSVITSDVLDGHCVFAVEIDCVQNFEGTVIERDTDFTVGVNADLFLARVLF